MKSLMKEMKIQGIFLLTSLLLLTSSASAINYYVDPSSWGTNKGTFTDPWKSIDDIPATINYFLPGDTVFFKRDQQYTGTLSINSSGSYTSPIVFMPYGSGNAPLFQYKPANPVEDLITNRIIIRLNQANYIVIDGFELTDASISEDDHAANANVGYGVFIYGGVNNNGYGNIIKNLTISGLGAGIAIDGGSYNTITDCTIRNMRMAVNTPDITGDDHGAVGIVLAGSNNTIIHNHIQDCWAFSYDYQYDGGAIEVYGPASSNKILYNTAIDNLGVMEFGNSTYAQELNNLVGYNLFINNGHVCYINMGNGFGVDVRNLQLFNNNIIETKPPRIADVTSLIGIYTTASVSNVITMKNNIFWLTTGINITDPVVQPFNGPQCIHQNNLYRMHGGSQGFPLDPSEMNLKANDSLFKDITSTTDPDDWDYTLRAASAAVNFGQNVGIAKDFFGNAVPVNHAPDAGIAESVSSSVLPLQIVSCKGWAGTNGNTIEWVTTDDPADHFEIEKSTGGNNFKMIATVPYKTNTGSLKYQYIDNEVANEVQYYRIKAIEPGSAGFYSQIISIKNNLLPDDLIVFPNPVRNDINLRLPGNNFLNKEMVLVNMSGIEVKRARIDDPASQIKLNVSMLPAGAYIIKLIDHTNGSYYKTLFTK